MAEISSGSTVTPSPATVPASTSIIENEIPAYRAISSLAIFSLILGAASLLCFASLWFLVVAVLAILTGTLALRQVAGRSDVLTGAGFARFGIVLALICGISASTSTGVQTLLLKREISQFAGRYAEVLATGSLGEAMWYHQPPSVRDGKNPEDLLAELKKTSHPGPGGDPFAMQSAPIVRIKDALIVKGSSVHFESVESMAVQGLTSFGNALLGVHSMSDKKDSAESEQFARVRVRKDATNAAGQWVVEEIEFPYKPASYVEKPAAIDDGHGHGSGGH